MLSHHKFFSLDGIVARLLRVGAMGTAGVGMTDAAIQCAALYGCVELFGVKRLIRFVRKEKKHGKGKRGNTPRNATKGT